MNETSNMLFYHPGLVDLSQLPKDRTIQPQGVGGKDPRDATPAQGRENMEASIALLKDAFQQAGLL